MVLNGDVDMLLEPFLVLQGEINLLMHTFETCRHEMFVGEGRFFGLRKNPELQKSKYFFNFLHILSC